MSFSTTQQTEALTIQVFDSLSNPHVGNFIPYSHYEDSEEDLRKKTAKFTTYKKLDITATRWQIYVYYKGQCIFAGVLLSTDYDETTGLYTYQCQDFNRWLTTKTWCVNEEGENNIYKLIKSICDQYTVQETSKMYGGKFTAGLDAYYLPKQKEFELYPDSAADTKNATNSSSSSTSNTSTDTNSGSTATSTITNSNSTTTNSNVKKLTTTANATTAANSTKTDEATTGFDQKPGVFYEDKTLEEILRSLIAGSNAAVDMYVDTTNTLRFDPIKLKSWQNPSSLYLTTKNLSGYTFKNDITNMVTQVTIKDTDIYKNHTITKPNLYSAEELMKFPLEVYFGQLNVFVQNPNATSATDTSSTGTATDTTSTTDTTGTSTDNSSTSDATTTSSTSTGSSGGSSHKVRVTRRKGKSTNRKNGVYWNIGKHKTYRSGKVYRTLDGRIYGEKYRRVNGHWKWVPKNG